MANKTDDTTNITPIKEQPINKSTLHVIQRDDKGRFLKGFTGNPQAWAARKINTQLAQLCRENVESNTSVLQSIINNPNVDPAVRIAGIKLSFEYGYGKPMNALNVQKEEGHDYNGVIHELAKAVHDKFDTNEINAIDDEKKIKQFIQKLIEKADPLGQLYDDLLSLSH